jgi:hypothetical protein
MLCFFLGSGRGTCPRVFPSGSSTLVVLKAVATYSNGAQFMGCRWEVRPVSSAAHASETSLSFSLGGGTGCGALPRTNTRLLSCNNVGVKAPPMILRWPDPCNQQAVTKQVSIIFCARRQSASSADVLLQVTGYRQSATR